MKAIAILAMVLFTSAIEKPIPYCMPIGFYVVSNNLDVHQNGFIILEFYALSQDIVLGLDKKYPVYLQSGDEKVKLLPIEILKGEFALTQVIFKSATALKQNKTYELRIENLPRH